MNQQQPQLNIKLEHTEKLQTPEGNDLVAEGIILRKASKFAIGESQDALIPIPVFYDVKTHKILKETLPKEIADEYETD